MEFNIHQEKEKQDQRSAFLLSLFLYGLFLGVLYLIELEYKQPDPVPFGVEVNFGTDLVGSGNIQTTNKANASKNNYDVKPPAKTDKKEEAKPVVKSTPPRPAPVVEKVKIKPTKPVAEKTLITSKAESPVAVKETKKLETAKPVKVTPAPVERPSNTNPRPNPTPLAPETKPAPPARTVDNGSIYKRPTGGSTGSNGTTGNRDGVGGNSNGDDKPGTVGDKGNPNGTLDGKSLYGTPGAGGSGASVNIAGWKRRKLELPEDGSAETGKIVFQVKVDDQGSVISINAIEKTVSPKVVDFYKRKIMERLSGVLDPEGNPPPVSTGTITILLK